MSLQERRSLRQKKASQRYCKTKVFASLVFLGCLVTASNPSVSHQEISLESLMSTTVGTGTSSHEINRRNPTNAWSRFVSPINHDNSQVGTAAIASNVASLDGLQCALCFFGLPRSYKEMVLPSIVKNVLEPNAKYNCDVFVHYYARKKELKGRLNPGGQMDPTEIFALKAAVEEIALKSKEVSLPPPAVIFSNDTERTFFDQRQEQIDKYLKTKGKFGKKLYFPWKDKSWKRSSLVNLIRQWHSIDNVFGTMENYMVKKEKNYTRVAMLRNDAMYLSPIDIFKLDDDDDDDENSHQSDQSNVTDFENQHFVIPPFANYPVNDRMIYGPYDAVKIWSTKRFDLVEVRAKKIQNRGNVMHSETFMQQSIIPAMEELGYKSHVHPGLCFIRTRTDSKALFNDCLSAGSARGFETDNATISVMESILGRSCTRVETKAVNRAHHLIQC